MMDAAPFFVLAGTHGALRLGGKMGLTELVGRITDAMAYARETGVRRLLVVMTEVTGLKSPGLAARYEFIRTWARVSGGLVRLALVMRAELIDSQEFGVTVAANAGMTANVFEDEKAALAWLLEEQ